MFEWFGKLFASDVSLDMNGFVFDWATSELTVQHGFLLFVLYQELSEFWKLFRSKF